MRRSGRENRLSPAARTDLEDIWLYGFRTWSADRADRYHHDIMTGLTGLAHGQRSGRAVDIRAGYFKYPVGMHFVFYRQSDAVIDVIRILHQRMDIGRHL